ncbi:uncharacterized protein PG998_012265 [Apiospora kogelbergensis]|uniref:uncharacterized protein n=1 Tax=Apiospora kogelbergensis TaxID=1337665 RepID=UPI00313139F1
MRDQSKNDYVSRRIDRPAGSISLPVAYVYRPLKDSEIRLLTLHPGEETDEICIGLRHVELQDNVPLIRSDDKPSIEYEALSYTWGTSISGQYVLVNAGNGDDDSNGSSQRVMAITDNLAVALRRLRNVVTAKTLWVDALCINQSDNTEKSIQVRRMGAVYRSAARVIVWLGPERDESALVMQLFEFTAARANVNWTTLVYTLNDNYVAEVSMEFGMGPYAFSAHVESLLGREWFKRVWVRQEVFLARQAVVLCGASEVGWDDFKNAAMALACKLSSLTYWSELSLALQGTECSNPRDRVYGMLALMYSDKVGLPDVDYSLCTAKVYTAVAAQYFQRSTNADLLMSCELTPDRMPGLPSWVPDWSSTAATADFTYGCYTATDTKPCVEFPMGVSGGVIRFPGVVKKASKIHAVEMMGSTHSEATDAILRFLQMVPAVEEEYVGEKCSLIEALCWAILCNKLKHKHIPRKETFITLEELRAVGHYLVYLFEKARLGCNSSEYTSEYKRFLDAGYHFWNGRALFLSEGGFVGLGPPSTSPGDTLFIPWGSRFPVLMRPAPGASCVEEKEKRQKQQWLVVGPCFVSGLMSGEVLYGPLPLDYCVIQRCSEDGFWRPEIHKMVIQGDHVVSTERDREYEKERVKQAFGVDNPRLVTPEMAISKGVPITWVDFI